MAALQRLPPRSQDQDPWNLPPVPRRTSHSLCAHASKNHPAPAGAPTVYLRTTLAEYRTASGSTRIRLLEVSTEMTRAPTVTESRTAAGITNCLMLARGSFTLKPFSWTTFLRMLGTLTLSSTQPQGPPFVPSRESTAAHDFFDGATRIFNFCSGK